MSDELPDGWVDTHLGNLIDGFQAGRNLSAHGRAAGPGEFGVLRISAVTWGSFRPKENKALLEGDQPKAHEVVQRGDLLITRANTSDLVGAVVLVNEGHPKLMLPDKILRLLTKPGVVDPRFLVHSLRSTAARDHFASNATGTSESMRNLSQPKLAATPIRLPPLAEQRRIAAQVESLLSRVNSARERLEKVPQLLKRFRQSVLTAACSGQLTEDWRRRTAGLGASLDALLSARKTSWEKAEVTKLAGRGKTATLADLQRRYRDPVFADDAFEIPATWVWASLDALTLIVGGITKGQKRAAGTKLRTVPYLRVANVQRGHLDLREIKTIEATEDEISEMALMPGDLLLNEGGDIDKLGRGWVWSGEIPECIHQNHVFRARPASDLVEPKFLSHYANTFGQKFFFDAGAQTVNLASVSMSKLRTLPVPCPPIEEQREIVRRVGELFALADSIERRTVAALSRAKGLSPAILQKAFAGKLVPTEAELALGDGRQFESAEELLRRAADSVAKATPAPVGARRGQLRKPTMAESA